VHHDPNFRPKERKLAFSALPKKLQQRFDPVRNRIQWLGMACDRDLIHVGFMGGGCEYWKKNGKSWKFLIGGYPAESDLPSLLRAVA
jgi:hypothetical protein